jgi:serine/threonine protein phosphatase PrpC
VDHFLLLSFVRFLKFILFLSFCSDGLWDVFEDQQAVDMVWKYQNDKENVAKRLITEALTRGSTDNITVVVAWL